MSNRIYDLAKQYNIHSKEILDLLKQHNIEVKSHMSTVDDAALALIRKRFEPAASREAEASDDAAKKAGAGSLTYIPPRKHKKKRPLSHFAGGRSLETAEDEFEANERLVTPPVEREAKERIPAVTAEPPTVAATTPKAGAKPEPAIPVPPAPERAPRQEPRPPHEGRPFQKPEPGKERKIFVQSKSRDTYERRTVSETKPAAPREDLRRTTRDEHRGRREDQRAPRDNQQRAPRDDQRKPRDEQQRAPREGQQGAREEYRKEGRERYQGKKPFPRPGQPGAAPHHRDARKPGAPTNEKAAAEGDAKKPFVKRPGVGRPTDNAEAQKPRRHRVDATKQGKKDERPGGDSAEAGKARRDKTVTKRHGTRNEHVADKRTSEPEEDFEFRNLAHRPSRPKKKSPTKTAVHKAAQAARLQIQPPAEQEGPKRLNITEMTTVKDLAEKMNIPPAKIIAHLMTNGIMANVNQGLDMEAAVSLAQHFGFEVSTISLEEEIERQEEAVDVSKLRHRSPVVTIMGHVDHGKTTLLDSIRESKIIDTEFGGITQHIGAYAVEARGQRIVFLDTPGHEAFTAMRARGAKVTDEVVLVVAADDGIMPQTIEAIDHARAAKVPIIVAINKIDAPGANPDRVMQEMTKYGLTPEEWGGDTICVKVSAKKRTNLDDLLEMILLQAEILELKADPDRLARGVIVEALLDKGRGPVATVLVQNGTLRIGDPFVVGQYYGRVRAMLDDRGNRVEEAGPATPVEVLGLAGVPTAGDSFIVVDNERKARQIAESRQEQQQKTEFAKTARITLEELHHHIQDGQVQELRIVIKADVHGSVEALTAALEKLSTEQVRLQVIHGGVGAINESDVMLASASNAIVLGFNVRPIAKAIEMAEKEQIDVRLYNIIYKAIDEVKKAMEGLLQPVYKEVQIGQAQVLQVFNLPKGGTIAGCRVLDGKITRSAIIHQIRENKDIFKGTIASLRRVKDDVREVLAGFECGLRLEGHNDVLVNDILQAYTTEKVTMTLEEAAAKPRKDA